MEKEKREIMIQTCWFISFLKWEKFGMGDS